MHMGKDDSLDFLELIFISSKDSTDYINFQNILNNALIHDKKELKWYQQ